jgi:hypothetical protein
MNRLQVMTGDGKNQINGVYCILGFTGLTRYNVPTYPTVELKELLHEILLRGMYPTGI